MSVCGCVCVCIMYVLSLCLLVVVIVHLFYYCLLLLAVYFIKRERKEGMELEGCGGHKDFVGNKEGETMVRINCMKTIYFQFSP